MNLTTSNVNLIMVRKWNRDLFFLYYKNTAAAAAAKSLQSCPTLCDPIDDSPPGSPAPGILQGRTLEWVAISFSNAWKWKVKVKLLRRVWPSATPWTAAFQLLRPWDFPGKSTGVGCHCFFWQWRRPQFKSWVRNIHWRRDRLPTPVLLGFPWLSW